MPRIVSGKKKLASYLLEKLECLINDTENMKNECHGNVVFGYTLKPF